MSLVRIEFAISLNNNLAKLHEMYKTNTKNSLFTSFMTLFRVRILSTNNTKLRNFYMYFALFRYLLHYVHI